MKCLKFLAGLGLASSLGGPCLSWQMLCKRLLSGQLSHKRGPDKASRPADRAQNGKGHSPEVYAGRIYFGRADENEKRGE